MNMLFHILREMYSLITNYISLKISFLRYQGVTEAFQTV